VRHRRRKAEKIIRLIEERRSLRGSCVLEVGTGSGVIANALVEATGAAGSVTSVDVVDERLRGEGYRFVQVRGTILPFADGSFDIVVSNHVMEHVGDNGEQTRHLAEMGRVLRPGGLIYLAVPNRWALREPHYRLLFLSWLPAPLRSRYLRASGKGYEYDCYPPGPLMVQGLFRSAELDPENLSVRALELFGEIEQKRWVQRVTRLVPKPVLRPLALAFPTLVFALSRRGGPATDTVKRDPSSTRGNWPAGQAAKESPEGADTPSACAFLTGARSVEP
jgi:SAM-dependent methyltransferase